MNADATVTITDSISIGVNDHTELSPRPVWPTSSSVTIPLDKFMAMPCETPAMLLDSAKAMLRLYGFQLDDTATVAIKIIQSRGEVEIEVYSEIPF
jgi:hypothetical protein